MVDAILKYYGAAQLPYQSFHGGESQSVAAAQRIRCAIEALEDTLEILRRQSAAFIPDLYLRPGFLDGGADADMAPRRRVPQGIVEQVSEDEGEPACVTVHAGA